MIKEIMENKFKSDEDMVRFGLLNLEFFEQAIQKNPNDYHKYNHKKRNLETSEGVLRMRFVNDQGFYNSGRIDVKLAYKFEFSIFISISTCSPAKTNISPLYLSMSEGRHPVRVNHIRSIKFKKHCDDIEEIYALIKLST